MKMDRDTFASLKAAIDSLFAGKMAEHWNEYKARGFSAERFRWDALHASGFKTAPLYSAGLNDSHIDTALRRIVPVA